MPRFKDSDIDKLFREAADGINPELDPRDWEDMSSRLDRGERGSGMRSRTLYTLAILLLISSAWMQWNGERTRQPAYIVKPETVNQRSAETILDDDQHTKSHLSAGQMRPGIKNVTNGQRSLVTPRSLINAEPISQALSINRPGEADEHDDASTPQLVSIVPPGDVSSDPVDVDALINLMPDDIPVIDSTADQGEIISKEAPAPARWSIKLPLSVDFSAIDYKAPGDPGVNIGLLAEYNVTRRLSVSSGMIWSKKLYDLKNPDKSYSSGGNVSKASMLNGDCRILDIPINITYYIFPERRTNLFVTIGSSSYIMLKEEYIYTVSRNQKEYQYTEEYVRKNNDWFSMLNVGFGIQHKINRQFILQAEPFLKAPMKGVGEGKVDLMSTGMFITLKHNFK